MRSWLSRPILALWCASAISLMATQTQELLEPPPPHPEMPGDDPRTTASVLEGCRRTLGPDDVLAVVYDETDGVQVFLAYRLAYVVYPTRVRGSSYGGFSGNAPATALAQALDGGPTHVLRLGRDDPGPGPGETLAQFGTAGRLYRVGPR